MIHELAQAAAHAHHLHGVSAVEHRVAIWLGMEDASGPIYLSWSGWVGDLGLLSIAAAGLGVLRAHNCHAKGCLRVGKHQVDGTPYKCCRRHAPNVPNEVQTSSQIAEAHRKYKMNG